MGTEYPTFDAIRVIAVIGAGSVGKSWAALHLAMGYQVVATDPMPGYEEDVRHFVVDAWAALRSLHPALGADPPLHRLSFARTAAEAVQGADLVQENAPENVDLKIRLIAELAALTPPHCVILSSTGGIGPTVLQSRCRAPERVVVAHPFNPPHIVPLVEIVGGAATRAEAVAWTRDFMTRLGKRPIILRREVPGHLANRLQAALLREAFHLLVEEVASPQDIDDAVRFGLGLRWALMGSLMTFHLAGGSGGAAHTLDLAAEAYESWWANLGNVHLNPETRAKIIAGTAQITGDRSIPDWVRWRDARLVELVHMTCEAAFSS